MLRKMTRNVLLLVAKCILITAALAQNNDHVLVYGTFSPLHVSDATTGAVPSGFLSATDQTGSLWAPGIGGGVTWNFVHSTPLAIGLDLRGSTKPGTPGADTAMIGIKFASCAAGCRFKPYGQFSFGYLDTRATNTSPTNVGVTNPTTFSTQYIAFEGFGGVDYSLRNHIDLRLCELGVGGGSEFALFVTEPHHPILFTLSTGVVFHF
jgi:hypothetical protein